MVLFPPLCLEIEIRDGYTSSGTNRWDCFIDIQNGGQTAGSLLYTGLTIVPDMWVGNGAVGYAFKIKEIISSSPDTIRCILEDVDGINAAIDPSGEGGGPRSGSTSYIFEVVNGLPAMSQVSNYPNITWTDSILGRFISTLTSPTGGTSYPGPTGPTGQHGASVTRITVTGPTGAIFMPTPSSLIFSSNTGSVKVGNPVTVSRSGFMFSTTLSVAETSDNYCNISLLDSIGNLTNLIQLSYTSPIVSAGILGSIPTIRPVNNGDVLNVVCDGYNVFISLNNTLYDTIPVDQNLTYSISITASGTSSYEYSLDDILLYATGKLGPTGPQGRDGTNTATGATGATGPTGPQYFSLLSFDITDRPNENDGLLVFADKNLAYTINNSVIIQNTSDPSTYFEAMIGGYNRNTGRTTLINVTNIYGSNYSIGEQFSINLTGKRGTNWYFNTGPPITSIGRVGDFYINKFTGELYIKTF